MFKCQECGKRIIDVPSGDDIECPRCGSTDIDLDDES
jgi:DNA-directed RNA polymerase subunit RPC12/RpoP